jgi:hypothetical protein
MAFLIVEAIKIIFESKKISSIPYSYVNDGVLGIISALIISSGYPASFSDLLLGPIFLAAVGVAISLSEWILMRPLTIVAIAAARATTSRRLRRFMNLERRVRQKMLVFLRTYKYEVSLVSTIPYENRAELIQSFIASVFKENAIDTQHHILPINW